MGKRQNLHLNPPSGPQCKPHDLSPTKSRAEQRYLFPRTRQVNSDSRLNHVLERGNRIYFATHTPINKKEKPTRPSASSKKNTTPPEEKLPFGDGREKERSTLPPLPNSAHHSFLETHPV
ncbi:hypothetical protein TNCT_318601 [Trichonephila clavata]|uniref:Uncharacterized protein n=1 Tax=Trichonephila clavata TaxID=2740835 RepID=A0A8X6LWG7_TRICU|nr:hypothetical protein TNCT_318601 [Trichonephila clavata]